MSLDSVNIKPYTQRVGTMWYTDDAVQVTGLTIPTRSDHCYYVEVDILATEQVDFDEVAGYKIIGTFKNDGGTLTLVGSVGAVYTAENTAGWAATLDVSGTNIRVRITGAASTRISWQIASTVIENGLTVGSTSSSAPQFDHWNG
jgi:hypothetical protein